MDRTVLKSKHLNQKYKERRELKEVQERSRKEEKILLIQRKLQKAEELKQQQILKKVAKAHDEESKKSEIHFINKMDAENKRHDILEKEKDSEKRLQDIEEERQRRLEEKAARESAVEERRKAIEAERQQRIDHIRRKREEKDKKIELQMQEKEKERLEAANQKARERELKLFAIEAAHQANVEELQKKILLKQEESKRRHEENIEQIRARAFELSVRRGSSMVGSEHAPALSPYRVKKMCSLCNLIIGSEVYLYSHLRSKKHQEAIQGLLDGVEPSKDQLECYNLKYIVDATNMTDSCSLDVKVDKETLKAINKTRKKLRQRLLVKGRTFEENWKNGESSMEINSPNKQTINKIMSKIQSLAKDNSPKSPWSGNDLLALERLLNQLIKLISLKNKQDLEYIFRTGAIPVFISFLSPLLELSNDKSPLLPEKIYALLCTILKEICANHLEICYYLLSSTLIISLLDLLALRLTLFSEESATVMSSSFSSATLPSSIANVRTFDPICSSLSILLSTIIRTLSDHAFVPWNDNPESFRQRVSDMISYSISIGIVDKLSLCIANSQGLVNSEQELARQLRNSLSFIVCLTMLLASIKNFGNLFSQIEPEDNTQFIITLRMTHIVGVIPLMYGALLNTGSTLRPQSPTPESPEHVLELALESLQLLNYFALLDLKMLQTILGSEGLSLQLRHIANYLIWYCTHWEADSLLHEVILLIGFFTVDNVDNQNVVHTGQRPTILEQLCSLPYEFFSGSNLSRILLPTLISCCYENEINCQILEQEVSSTILSSFIDKEIINNQVKATLKRKSLENLIESRVTNDRWSLKFRFPKNKWLSAKKYFEK